MKTLTIKEPWVTAIFRYGKDIENRSWTTNYRGRLLIHTAKTKPTNEEQKAFFDICERTGIKNAAFNLSNCGLIIGSVELFSIDKFKHFDSFWAMDGQYHWKLINPILFDNPIPAKGQLGLWDFNGDIS